jgi:hypothetical protein
MTKTSDMDGAQIPQQETESFMEPRTIPKHWDVSAFETQDASSRDEAIIHAGESKTPADNDPSQSDGTSATFESFPQPKTVPGNWDVSDLI